MSGNDGLQNALQRALRYQGGFPGNWAAPIPGISHDVLIIGGGQNALALTLALKNLGIANVAIVDDRAPGEAGIWDDTARMQTLRTPKTLVGPDLGFAPLSFPTWFEAQHGVGAFEKVERIGRLDWAAYMRWFEMAANIVIRHNTRVVLLEPLGDHFAVQLETPEGRLTETARKVVIASGIGGLGAPGIPDFLTQALPRDRYAHTAERLDYATLKGKVVGVIGAAASAFDAAAVALEQGAAGVHMFCRKEQIPTLQINKSRAYLGAQDLFYTLPDALKWTLFNRVNRTGTPPPRDSVLRATRFDNFHIHLGRSLDGLHFDGDRIVLPFAAPALEFVIAGTGYVQNVSLRPELQTFSDRIATWKDRYTPPADEVNPGLGNYPYLGNALEFLPREEGDAPFLANLHAYTNAAALSYGRFIGDVPSMKFGITHLSRAIFNDVFRHDLDRHIERVRVIPTDREFEDVLYETAVWRK
ncbi:NAD(P)-binding domain-containing protein [Agrobacterium vitis]|uniref:SidA/IucD/PvdA family monooxygenase n=1 Tax=Agrobacterium vitis TaxID=373 RepID=A0ABW9TGM8_AGRVI|nr:NAD(P)/FAD-dependent oxidoreductase [Agrobacterium vitis]MUO43026.1 SidA/IucD/PvdA family monooxygenase [Agrobacterium vitis]